MFFWSPNNCGNVVSVSSSTEYWFESPCPSMKMFQHFQILKYKAWCASDSDDGAVASPFLRLKSPDGLWRCVFHSDSFGECCLNFTKKKKHWRTWRHLANAVQRDHVCVLALACVPAGLWMDYLHPRNAVTSPRKAKWTKLRSLTSW